MPRKPAARPAQSRRGSKTPPRRARADERSRPPELVEIEAVREQLERLSRRRSTPRWNADPEEVRRAVVKLVLTLVEFVRQILERQAIRRMEAGTLTPEETEAVGLALMRLEETVREIGAEFGLSPEDLNLDLGPVGRLM